MANLFVSDTHFGHKNILKFEPVSRPFMDTDHMDEVLISNWNAVVAPDDSVYHLGDAVMGDFARGIRSMQRLNGRKFLIPGNHDRVFSGMKNQDYRDRYTEDYLSVFETILPEQVEFTLADGTEAVLCHFPYTGDHGDVDRYPENRPVDLGRVLIHGHVHSLWHTRGRQFNVGVDVNNMTPVSEQVLIEWAQTV